MRTAFLTRRSEPTYIIAIIALVRKHRSTIVYVFFFHHITLLEDSSQCRIKVVDDLVVIILQGGAQNV